ncbi:hypothetical protein [Parasaccharibacter sp. TMW 2.1891]|uniref:hypothetical protein n=1 Tax=Parasaccharibacter sp. TMW 2.1891 TaxID=2267836 RepID=UPI00201218BB|nr:hypothetical protein [Parasaccharibacter sp. TMW 2.1891]
MLSSDDPRKEILKTIYELYKIKNRRVFFPIYKVNATREVILNHVPADSSYKKDVNYFDEVLLSLEKEEFISFVYFHESEYVSLSKEGYVSLGITVNYVLGDNTTPLRNSRGAQIHHTFLYDDINKKELFPVRTGRDAVNQGDENVRDIMVLYCGVLNNQEPRPSIEEAEMLYKNTFGNLDIEFWDNEFFNKFRGEDKKINFSNDEFFSELECHFKEMMKREE